jgi:hypothetical protein
MKIGSIYSLNLIWNTVFLNSYINSNGMLSHVYTSLSLSLSVFLSNTYIKLLCNFEFFNKNVSILLLMTIYVVGIAFFLYKTSCWQMCTPNSTHMSFIPNSNLVVRKVWRYQRSNPNQLLVLRIMSLFMLDKIR